jgi:hypothetical protein
MSILVASDPDPVQCVKIGIRIRPKKSGSGSVLVYTLIHIFANYVYIQGQICLFEQKSH